MGMIAYSNDLREKIILFFENHPDFTHQEVADEFGVSRSFIEKLLQRQRATNSSAALPPSGGQQSPLRAHEEKIRGFVADQPDITLDELRAKLKSATGLVVSRAALCRELQRLNLPRKKRLINQVSKNVRM